MGLCDGKLNHFNFKYKCNSNGCHRIITFITTNSNDSFHQMKYNGNMMENHYKLISHTLVGDYSMWHDIKINNHSKNCRHYHFRSYELGKYV